jgi:UDPglucose--hexose-1-phosphate uridylyltransferase
MNQGGLVWEQRWHPLRGEWILFTSHRSGRPWVGETVPRDEPSPPSYDPHCALCPGNQRLHAPNPPYTGVYCFANDLPCFSADAPFGPGDDFYQTRPAHGTAEVVCYHPDHSRTFADLSQEEAVRVVEVWTERYRSLGARTDVQHVLIFENKGALVGTSNPHPHCQIYAGNLIYGHIAREVENARAFFARTGRAIGQEVLQREATAPRVVCENDSFLACVPWFARYAYEVFVLPRRQVASLAELTPGEQSDLAVIMRDVAIRYDNLWRRPLPYIMALHQAPTDGQDYSFFPFHIEYHPPLRKPDTMKFLAGPEVGGGSMTNESNPDEKAAELRAVSSVLYRQQP